MRLKKGLTTIVLVVGLSSMVVSWGWASERPTEPTSYRIADTSQVDFTGSTTLFSFEGRAENIGGTVFYSPGNYSTSRVDASVPVKSMTTFNDWRDEDMYQLFEADSYPRVSFRTKDFDVSSATHFDTGTILEGTLIGEFEIHGVTHSETVGVTATVRKNHLEATSRFKLDITDFGLTPPTVMFISSVSPVVKVRLNILARGGVNDGE